MPDILTDFTPQEIATLERLQKRLGLASLRETAEYALRQALQQEQKTQSRKRLNRAKENK